MLFQALANSSAASMLMVAPKNGAALRSTLEPGQRVADEKIPAVLWLDDIEPFLNEGVTLTTLEEWRAGNAARVVVGTYGGKGSDLIGSDKAHSFLSDTTSVLQYAEKIQLPGTTDAELQDLGLSNVERRRFRDMGWPRIWVAGPALESKLVTQRSPGADSPSPAGVALVIAAADWSRCGRTDAISEELLRDLWKAYPMPGLQFSDAEFEMGITWACEPVAGTISLMESTEGFAPTTMRFAWSAPCLVVQSLARRHGPQRLIVQRDLRLLGSPLPRSMPVDIKQASRRSSGYGTAPATRRHRRWRASRGPIYWGS